jgi:hypothetical protein
VRRHATPRQLRQDRERLQQEPRRAQRYLQAWEQALVDLGLPEPLGAESEWRRQAHVKLRGNIFGMLLPTMFGCRTLYELMQERVWDKHFPSRLRGALPQQPWSRQWPRRGQALMTRLWQQAEAKSPATWSRWPWTWVGDDRVFKKAGQQLGWVGTW